MGVTHLAFQLYGRILRSPARDANRKKFEHICVYCKTSQHGLRLMPRAQTSSLPFHDDSTKRARMARPKSMVLVSCSSLRRSVLTAVRV